MPLICVMMCWAGLIETRLAGAIFGLQMDVYNSFLKLKKKHNLSYKGGNMSREHYSLFQMRGDLVEIARQASQVGFQPTAILGIARGGLIPATFLSQYYNIPCYTYQYSLRDHSNSQVNEEILDIVSKHNVLVVDDICDGGHTLAHVAEMLSQKGAYPRFAVLHYNVGQNVFNHVDFFANEINKAETDVWIDYEWEQWWR